ncbi:MAG: hypothetical protein NNA20_10590 [Nitrospira sp.]|nr:hypothetical protein [Nitrospira sp.]
MWLAGVTTLEDVSRFLAAYLPRYSQRFTVPPVRAADLHRPRLTAYVLERSLCIKNRGVYGRTSPLPIRGGSIN